MKRIIGIAGIVSAALLISLTGCSSESEESQTGYDKAAGESKTAAMESAPATFNKECPMMGGEVDPEVATVEYQGKTIGFCCEDCLEEWAALATDKKDEFIAGVMKAAEEGKEMAGEAMEEAGDTMEGMGEAMEEAGEEMKEGGDDDGGGGG